MLGSLLSIVTLGLLVIAAPVIEERQACSDVIVFFARGTTETAPIGSTVGPALQSALRTALGGRSLTFTGVNYAADIAGFLAGGDPQGSRTMATLLTNAASACPNSALVTSGYSQGGQLVHNSARLISASVASHIKAAVIFGDPDNGQSVQGVSAANTRVFCHFGDNICQGGALVLAPHLTYHLIDMPAAASFIASHI
ncbi:cutinase [Mycena rebaudengoi]|nr:cutinase [Mycena rebaudengoi]